MGATASSKLLRTDRRESTELVEVRPRFSDPHLKASANVTSAAMCYGGGSDRDNDAFESRRSRQLNTVISRIPPLGPIVLWFVLNVSNPSNRFDILQSKFHRCNQPQWSSVFNSQWLSIIVSCK